MLASWAPSLWVLGLWATFSHGTNIGELTQAYIWLPDVLGSLHISDHMHISVIWYFWVSVGAELRFTQAKVFTYLSLCE